jgi:2,4-dienoyl-CoA reductase-like NADH-dependent reductase (Old Yellow Enzyme family)
MAMDRDDVIPNLRLLSDAIHGHGCKVIAQLSHAGVYGDPKLTGRIPQAVSSGIKFVSYPVQELTPQKLKGIINAFVNAARRSHEAGFDGIQIHAAHGYLLNQFLSRAYNARTDDLGGSVINRAFPLLEIIRGIRELLGPDFPILVKLNSRDYLKDGIELEESLEIGRLVEGEGADAIEISGGTRESGVYKSIRPGFPVEGENVYYEEAARSFRAHLEIPTMLVGGIRRYETAEDLVESGVTDFIALSRPLIREPDLIERWRNGDTGRSNCLFDNDCLVQGLNNSGITCRYRQCS